MKSGKHLAVAGWILAGSGTGLLVATGLVETTEDVGVALWSTVNPEAESTTNYTPAYIAGAAMLAGGIGLLIASSHKKNKAKSMDVSLNMETSKLVKSLTYTTVAYPALKFSFSF